MNPYKEWIGRAEYNFKLAQTPIEEGTYLEELCYNAQQATEKALKGLLVFFDIDPPHTHNIGRLLESIANVITVPKSIYSTSELTKYSHETRYPGNYKDISLEEYKRIIEITKNCLNWVDEITNMEGN